MVIAGPTIHKSKPRLKYAIFTTLWILSFPALIIFTNNKLNTLYNDAISKYPKLKLPKNQTGTLSYIHSDTENNHRPIYSICFKNLHVENNNLGIFKTALHKAVKIQDLQLRFYQYPSTEAATTNLSHIPSVPEEITTHMKTLIKDIIHKLTTPANEWWLNFNLGNVSEIQVNNFDYRVFYDNDLFLSIKSKKAAVTYKEEGITLRGHVTITSADGGILESNHVKWDIKKQHFTVNGFYVLNRNGTKTMGEDICVDTQLNNTKVKQAELKRKEAQECFAKLQ